jgi:hypothetical protein
MQHLIRGCHQTGALEKALEVLSWMSSVHAKPSAEMFGQLEEIVELAQLWDRKVFKSAPAKPAVRSQVCANHASSPRLGKNPEAYMDYIPAVILPEALRPAPYDGKRASYLVKHTKQFEARSETLSHGCNWIPSHGAVCC